MIIILLFNKSYSVSLTAILELIKFLFSFIKSIFSFITSKNGIEVIDLSYYSSNSNCYTSYYMLFNIKNNSWLIPFYRYFPKYIFLLILWYL